MEDLVPETTEQAAALAAAALTAVDQPAAVVEEVAAEDLEVRKRGQMWLAATKQGFRVVDMVVLLEVMQVIAVNIRGRLVCCVWSSSCYWDCINTSYMYLFAICFDYM